MRTAYKTRAWHFLRALSYAHSIDAREGVARDAAQVRVWLVEMATAVRNAFASSGSEELTPSASYWAMEAVYVHEPYQPVYPHTSAFGD